MSRDTKVIDQMEDYVRQLRRHAEGRRAVHIRLSGLERHFREEHYRLFCASTLRPLVTKHGATMFALPNADIILITKDAGIDDIGPQLALIRRKFKKSAFVAGLDPVVGESDRFIEWFDLSRQYDVFRLYVEHLCETFREPEETVPAKLITIDPAVMQPKDSAKGASKEDDRTPRLSMPRHVRVMPISAPSETIEDRELDPEMLLTLARAINGADMTGLLRKQRVMAILGDEAPMPVFVHKQVPQRLLFETLLKGRVLAPNRWLSGYLADLVAEQVLLSAPAMGDEHSLAASLRVTALSVMSDAFDLFDHSLGSQPRSKVILEFSILDMVANPRLHAEARNKASSKGYRLLVADVDPATFVWLDHTQLQAAFVKVRKPREPERDWLDNELETMIHHRIDRIGMARAIFDGCNRTEDIALGQRLGFTLFQGEAVDPLTSAL